MPNAPSELAPLPGAKSSGCLNGIEFDKSITTRLGEMRVVAYWAYDAFGLIGPEQGGVCVALVMSDGCPNLLCAYGLPFARAQRMKLAVTVAEEIERLKDKKSIQKDLFKFLSSMPNPNKNKNADAKSKESSRIHFDMRCDIIPDVGATFGGKETADSYTELSGDDRSVLADWVNLVKSGLQRQFFTGRLYRAMSLVAPTAAYDVGGFYGTYIVGPDKTVLDKFSPEGDMSWVSIYPKREALYRAMVAATAEELSAATC